MDPKLSQKIEAVLFASGRFMDESRIAELAGVHVKNAHRALEALQESYAQSGSALQIIEEDNAWKLHVRDEFLELVSRVVSDTEVSGPVLETLAIIAWRSPVLQSKVVDIRGSNAYEHIKELVERGFITKDPEGRSYRLKVTEKFFEYFDIEGREDIRKVFKEVEERHRKEQSENELEQKRLQKALKEVEKGKVSVVDIKDNKDGERPSIDDLDKVLTKSKKAREILYEEIKESKPKEEEHNIGEEQEDISLEEATKIRKKVEEEAEEIARKAS